MTATNLLDITKDIKEKKIFSTSNTQQAIAKQIVDEFEQELSTHIDNNNVISGLMPTILEMRQLYSGKDETFKTANFAHMIVKYKHNTLAMDEPAISIRPTRNNKLNEITTLEKMVRNFWKTNDMQSAVISPAIKASCIDPLAITKVSTNQDFMQENEGAIMSEFITFQNIDIIDFIWDTKYHKLENMRFAGDTRTTTWNEIERTPAFAKHAETLALIKEYSNIDGELQMKKFNNTHPYYNAGAVVYANDANDEFFVYEIYYKYKINKTTYQVAKFIVIADFVLERSDDTGLHRLPYSTLREIAIPRSFLGSNSLMVTAKQIKNINQIDEIIATTIKLIKSPPVIVSSEANINIDDFARGLDQPGSVYPVDSNVDQAVRVFNPIKLDQGLILARQALRDDAMRIAGISKLDEGGAPNSVSTTGAMKAIAQQNAVKEVERTSELRKYINKLVRIVIDIIQNIPSVAQTFRVDNVVSELTDSKRKELFEFLKLNSKNLKNIQVDVEISIPFAQQERQRIKELIVNILTLQQQTGQRVISIEDLLKLEKIPELDAILRRSILNREKDIEFNVHAAAKMAAGMTLQFLSDPKASQNIPQDKLVEQVADITMQTIAPRLKQTDTSQADTQPKQTSVRPPQEQDIVSAQGKNQGQTQK